MKFDLLSTPQAFFLTTMYFISLFLYSIVFEDELLWKLWTFMCSIICGSGKRGPVRVPLITFLAFFHQHQKSRFSRVSFAVSKIVAQRHALTHSLTTQKNPRQPNYFHLLFLTFTLFFTSSSIGHQSCQHLSGWNRGRFVRVEVEF